MANVDAPNGFTPVRHLTGGTIRMEEMPIASGEAAAIFSGDVVELQVGGTIKVGTATSGLAACGVFAGCSYTASDGTPVYSKHWPAGTVTQGTANAIGYVYSDPFIVFAAQTSGTAAEADNGAHMDLEATAGSVALGRSRQEVNEDATAVDQFKQIGLVKKPDNAWGANAEIEVMFQEHVRLPSAGTEI